MRKVMSSLTRPPIQHPHPMRRSTDIEVVLLDEVGATSPKQRARVLIRDMDRRLAPLSKDALADLRIRNEFARWGRGDIVSKLDAVIAERRLGEDFSQIPCCSLDSVLHGLLQQARRV
jgi:hypothetical protein